VFLLCVDVRLLLFLFVIFASLYLLCAVLLWLLLLCVAALRAMLAARIALVPRAAAFFVGGVLRVDLLCAAYRVSSFFVFFYFLLFFSVHGEGVG